MSVDLTMMPNFNERLGLWKFKFLNYLNQQPMWFFMFSGKQFEEKFEEKKHIGEKLNKCNQCDYTSSQKGHLRTYLKTHSREKSYKCYQCDYAFYQKGPLRTHLKTHSEEKSNICNQCDFSSSQAANLRRHLKHTVEKSQTNAVNVIFHVLWQAIWRDIW